MRACQCFTSSQQVISAIFFLKKRKKNMIIITRFAQSQFLKHPKQNKTKKKLQKHNFQFSPAA